MRFHEEPSLNQVKELKAAGRIPEWFVSEEWLAKQFGRRPSNTTEQGSEQPARLESASRHDAVTALKDQSWRSEFLVKE